MEFQEESRYPNFLFSRSTWKRKTCVLYRLHYPRHDSCKCAKAITQSFIALRRSLVWIFLPRDQDALFFDSKGKVDNKREGTKCRFQPQVPFVKPHYCKQNFLFDLTKTCLARGFSTITSTSTIVIATTMVCLMARDAKYIGGPSPLRTNNGCLLRFVTLLGSFCKLSREASLVDLNFGL